MTQRRSTEERQRQIAEVALELISEEGVVGFTTAALSERVGLAEGTIFRHFSSKQDIALAAIELLRKRLQESFPDEEAEPLERLGLFMRHRLQLVLAHRGVFRAFFSDQLAMIAGRDGVEKMEEIKAESVEFLHQCLHEAADEGKLRVGVSPQFLSHMIQGTVHAFLFGKDPEDEEEQPERLASRTWSALVELIGR